MLTEFILSQYQIGLQLFALNVHAGLVTKVRRGLVSLEQLRIAHPRKFWLVIVIVHLLLARSSVLICPPSAGAREACMCYLPGGFLTVVSILYGPYGITACGCAEIISGETFGMPFGNLIAGLVFSLVNMLRGMLVELPVRKVFKRCAPRVTATFLEIFKNSSIASICAAVATGFLAMVLDPKVDLSTWIKTWIAGDISSNILWAPLLLYVLFSKPYLNKQTIVEVFEACCAEAKIRDWPRPFSDIRKEIENILTDMRRSGPLVFTREGAIRAVMIRYGCKKPKNAPSQKGKR